MKIAQVAPPFEPVPPVGYGGTERVVSTLAEELVRRGHQVTLFASGDSRTAARLVPTVDRALWRSTQRPTDLDPYWSVVLGKLARELDRFDLVHSHVDHFGFALGRLAPCPVVTTLHGRLDLPGLAAVYREFPEMPLVSISESQRRPAPDANWVATIHHGIDLEQYTFNPKPGQHLAFLGRVSAEKGLATAIRVARRVGMPLKAALRLPLPDHGDPTVRADWEYYENVVQPLVRENDVELLGQLGQQERDALLGNAAAVLFPIDWPEPFGLVMVEALACGTPVVALRRGSVPEVIEHGVTGFVCDDEDGLVDAVRHLRDVSRERCWQEARRRFSAAGMVDRYEVVYERLLRGVPAPPSLIPGGRASRRSAARHRGGGAAPRARVGQAPPVGADAAARTPP